MADSSMQATLNNFEREFLNAETTYDRWRVFQRVSAWASTASELAEERQKDCIAYRKAIKETTAELDHLRKELDGD
jgi:uncharacterized lipoprotein NlpE involved in copper resistance